VIGKTISHYRVEKLLGAGGMGEVWLAEDESLNRKVALKFLPEALQDDAAARKRFAREARSAAAIDHPYVCKIFEVGEFEGRAFIAMEFVDGEDMRETLDRRPLPVHRSLEVAVEIAEALEAAHEKGIVHRDLKPANIMLTRTGHVKVMDFGLARQVLSEVPGQDLTAGVSTTAPGIVPGTLAYMSPEQVRGLPVDTRSDIFSFGIVLYEMLTGIDPLKKSTPMDTANAVLNEIPPPLARYARDAPELLQHTVGKMLAKGPEDRFQSVHEVRTDLIGILRGGRDVATAEPGRSVVTRLRPVWLTLVALILIFTIAATSWWVQDRFFTSPAEALAFEERDWIIVADFDNQTGEDVFDKALDMALRVSIEQSSYVNVLPDRRIKEALRRMEVDEPERFDAATAREVAEREGIKAVLIPSILGVAGSYILTAVLQDPIRGTSVKSEMVRVEAREGVLAALDELSQSIRRDLGESIAAISRQSKPLAEVTTSSLEALKQYSLGIDNHWQGKFQEARAFYEDSLRADPDFTAAMASLGMIQFENFDQEKGKQLLSQAVEKVSELTDKERYGILAFHARAVENDLEKAIRYYRALLALYPDDGPAHNNLGWFYFQMGRYPESADEYHEAIRIDPAFLLTYDGLNRIYLYHILDIEAAIDLCNRQLRYDDRQFWAYDNLGWAYLGKGEYENAREAFMKALGVNPNSTLEMYRLGHSQRLAEDYAAALETFQKILSLDPSAYPAHYLIGLMYRQMEEEERATLRLQRYLAVLRERIRSNPDNSGYYIQAGLGYGRLGDHGKAEEMAEKALSLNPEDHFSHAQVLSVMGRKDQALHQLELAVRNGWTNYIWLKVHVDLENLHGEARFQELLTEGFKTTGDR